MWVILLRVILLSLVFLAGMSFYEIRSDAIPLPFLATTFTISFILTLTVKAFDWLQQIENQLMLKKSLKNEIEHLYAEYLLLEVRGFVPPKDDLIFSSNEAHHLATTYRMLLTMEEVLCYPDRTANRLWVASSCDLQVSPCPTITQERTAIGAVLENIRIQAARGDIEPAFLQEARPSVSN